MLRTLYILEYSYGILWYKVTLPCQHKYKMFICIEIMCRLILAVHRKNKSYTTHAIWLSCLKVCLAAFKIKQQQKQPKFTKMTFKCALYPLYDSTVVITLCLGIFSESCFYKVSLKAAMEHFSSIKLLLH